MMAQFEGWLLRWLLMRFIVRKVKTAPKPCPAERGWEIYNLTNHAIAIRLEIDQHG